MDDTIRAALGRGHVIDMTTIGRHSGTPRRIEIVFHNIDGRIVISGMPVRGRTRAWIHNLEADPRVTLHFKGPVAHGDVEGTARIVTDPAERRQMLTGVARNWNRTDIDLMVEASPLIEVTIPGYPF
ncbi:MAG TPA: nitroreductase family deazaflavin-dependent oxidoreductase [Candidatus Limnocylindrales bacterium]|jgi:deazaflavin-dependent oxidoreductase (nitroreductase family)